MSGLVCLLPARNAAGDLPGWLAGVRGWVDAVVALDDGSTDATADVLAADPLVRVLLRNPVRASYAGWDDAANRSRLLAAAEELEPDWVLWLDADERIPADDAQALRAFVDTDALPGLAYGFRVHRMVDDDHYDHADLWVYRLFAWAPGQQLPDRRLHFVPVPTDIGPERYVETNVRIVHLAGLTEDRRHARLDKYLEADPDHEFQADYGHLVAPPGDRHRVEPRPAELPVLTIRASASGLLPDVDAPALSAIVIAQDDEASIEGTLRSVVDQRTSLPFEVIVVTSGRDRTAEIVRRGFPEVRHVELEHSVLPGSARNAGVRLALGDFVSFPGSHIELPPGSLEARLQAHLAGWEMVTGSMRNATASPSGWASYFLDHGSALPGRPSAELDEPPVHCSYTRHMLEEVGGFPEDRRAGEDTVVNLELFRLGYRAYRAADIELYHRSPCATVPRLLQHHFARGQAWGQILLEDGSGRLSLVRNHWRELLDYAPRRWRGVRQSVRAWGGPLRDQYRRVQPLIGLAIGAAFGGLVQQAVVGSPSPQRSSGRRSLGPRPVFLHIPKTAGTAFRRALEDRYGPDRVLPLYGELEDVRERVRTMTDAEWEQIRAIAGHMEFGVHEVVPFPVRYVTLLRDPVDRIVSHYAYARATPDLPVHQVSLAGVDDFESYITSSSVAKWFNNGQTRYLGGDFTTGVPPAQHATLEQAKQNLRSHFAVVGLRERYAESLLLARAAFGWDWPRCEVVNETAGRPATDAISERTLTLIRERNALDVELYAFAQDLFDEQVATYGPRMDEDVALLATRAQRATSS